MSIDAAISALYIFIAVMFSINFKNLFKKYKQKKLSKLSLAATVSLIITFLSLGVYFLTDLRAIVLASQIYLIATMVFIKFSPENKR